VTEVLPGYASARNDATRADGASGLSPYLHFGVLGPREVMTAVAAADAGSKHKAKFADELLGWREWFHYQARDLAAPERYDRVAGWAVDTLADHAADLERLPEAVPGRRLDAQQSADVLGQTHHRDDAQPGSGMVHRLLSQRPAQPRRSRPVDLREYCRDVRGLAIGPRTTDLRARLDTR